MSHDSKKEWPGIMYVGEPVRFHLYRREDKERSPFFENKEGEEEEPPFEEGNWVEAEEDVRESFGSREHLIKKGGQFRVREIRWGSAYKQWYVGLDGVKGLYKAAKFVKIRASAQRP